MDRVVVVLKDENLKGYVEEVRKVFKVVDVVYYGRETEKDADLFVAIGGDGTFLWACHIAGERPVIGFKGGRIGFLATFRLEEMGETLLKVKVGDIKPESRIRLKVWDILALNDITINAQEARMIEISLKIGKHREIGFRGDGVIISTPTGSTAYNLAAGGPIVLPDIPAFVITPISPHTLTLRPIVVSANEKIKLKVFYRESKPLLSADGRAIKKLENGEEIEITYGKPALIYSGKDFFESLFQNLVSSTL
jgi:NAD+ kinase